MKKKILLGIFSFLLATLWLLPLSIIKPYAEKMVNGLKLEGVRGTVWRGGAQHFTANNNYLGKVNWHVQPLQSLTSLSLKSNFSIDGDELSAMGLAGLTLDNKIILNNTQFDLNASYINRLQKNTKLSGNFKGNIKYAEIDQQVAPQIDGVVDWKEGAVNSPIKIEAGDYRAVIKPVSGDLDIKLSSNEAPIELNGDFKLKSDWTFTTKLRAKTNNPGLSAMLNLAGKPQADGSVLINKTGNLKPYISR
jgi:hypothetical protein